MKLEGKVIKESFMKNKIGCTLQERENIYFGLIFSLDINYISS